MAGSVGARLAGGELKHGTLGEEYYTNKANSAYTSNSAKAWYLVADPTDLPVIELAFLNGQESPTIETAQGDFNVLGVRMRGYRDSGVALKDPSVPRVEALPFTWRRGCIVA